jgi:hypothetical protein
METEQTGGSPDEQAGRSQNEPAGKTAGVREISGREEPSLAFMLSCYDVWSATPKASSSIDCADSFDPNGAAPSAAPAAGSKIE